ncbi:MAG: hypothetical protein NTX25_13900 [Proteobacteria bacterium]|nr:hypothetical protein [Pseudomonadota bacterium]
MSATRISFFLLFASLCLPGRSEAAMAWLRASQSYIEQGDYLLQPGLQVAMGLEDGSRYSLDFTGRRYGSFLETTTMLTRDKTLPIFPWPSVTALYGISLLDEYTGYDPPKGTSQGSHSVNLGINLGLAWNVWQYEQWTLTTEWNAHLFAAGLAVILLTTARKSVFTLGVEYSL